MPGIESVEVAAGASARTTEYDLTTFPRSLTMGRVGPRLIPLALALVTFLVFLPALWNGFVEWDDYVNLYENEGYRGLTWPQIRWMFSTTLMGHWIPLTWLTFGLDYVIWEMNPAGYHLTSLVIFAANAAVFYFVALRLLGRRLFRGRAPSVSDRGDALLRRPPASRGVCRLADRTA